MSRIAGVPARGAGALVRFSYAQSRRMMGAVPAPLTVMAHHRPTMLSYGALESIFGRSRGVDQRLKELAWLKAARMMGCEWCIDYGTMVLAQEHGITPEQLAELPRHRESSRFTEVEKLVLDLAAGMTVTPVDVPDELVAALREHFSDAQLVELTYAIALENLRGRFNWALGIGAQGFADGSALGGRERETAAI